MEKTTENNSKYRIVKKYTETGDFKHFVEEKGRYDWSFIDWFDPTEQGLEQAKKCIKDRLSPKPKPEVIGYYK